MGVQPVRFRVWSDYLCPWCFNASVRLRRVAREYPGEVDLEWRSYLLRPHASSGRRWSTGEAGMERFRAYTRSWLRPAAEPDAGRFRPWEGDAGPPSHSVPPHVVAKAAARIGDDAFDRIHERLLEGYFAENRDITDAATLRELWSEAGLLPDAFPALDDDFLVRETLRQHDEAIEAGVTGVPSVQLVGNDAVVMGAQPMEVYRRWIDRTLARRGAGERT